jgi:hypothetical protein
MVVPNMMAYSLVLSTSYNLVHCMKHSLGLDMKVYSFVYKTVHSLVMVLGMTAYKMVIHKLYCIVSILFDHFYLQGFLM